MKFAFVLAEKAVWPVSVMCEVLGVSRSGYYAWQGRPASARDQEDDELVVAIKAAHKGGRGKYGSPRVHRALRKNGTRVGRKRVARLMRREGIVAKRSKNFRITTDSNHTDPIAPNILKREFNVAQPNAAWVTDVTYVWTQQGWLYLAAILDLCSRRVVGWATSANNDRQLALDALERAATRRRPPPELLHHSDRGSVYASLDYRKALSNYAMTPSMSRKGDCWDNEEPARVVQLPLPGGEGKAAHHGQGNEGEPGRRQVEHLEDLAAGQVHVVLHSTRVLPNMVEQMLRHESDVGLGQLRV